MMVMLVLRRLERLLSRPMKLDQEEVGACAEDGSQVTREEGDEPPVIVGCEHLAPDIEPHWAVEGLVPAHVLGVVPRGGRV